MADFEIIEADFQQYYNLDVSQLGFRRYARLLVNLPLDSRIVQKYSPFKDWNWDKEMQSQILHAIDTFATMYANANRKKGAKAIKPSDQVQPDYVKKAKKEAKGKLKEVNEEQKIELEEIFAKKNNQVNNLESDKNGA